MVLLQINEKKRKAIKPRSVVWTHYIQIEEGEACLVPWKFDYEAERKALAEMIVIDELPFKFVENEGFWRFMDVVCPHFNFPSRFTEARDWLQICRKDVPNDLFEETPTF